MSTSFEGVTALLIEKRAAVVAQLGGYLAELPEAQAAQAAARDAANAAGRDYDRLNLRITRALRDVADGGVASGLRELVDEARAVRDRADAAHSLAKQTLANIEYYIGSLRDDLRQFDRVIEAPLSGIGAQPQLEVVPRPPPPGPQEIDPIVFPVAISGERAA
jgi:hypothetical protein